MTDEQALIQLNKQCVSEFGTAMTSEIMGVLAARIQRNTGWDDRRVLSISIPELVELMKKTRPPRDLFGKEGTMGELSRVLEVLDVLDSDLILLNHARNRHEVLKTTAAYKELAKQAQRMGIL